MHPVSELRKQVQDMEEALTKVSQAADGRSRTKGESFGHTHHPPLLSALLSPREVLNIKIQNLSEGWLWRATARGVDEHQGIFFNCLFTQTDCLFLFGSKLGDVSFCRALIIWRLIRSGSESAVWLLSIGSIFFLLSRKFEIYCVIFKEGEKKS